MFKDITSRVSDASNASLEVIIMLAVAFLLGFLFCYFRNKSQED
ncbi:MAG: hypothetical protein PHE17_14740 [Thiothrix sp.]|jgi:hypothetical protein|nr:hypothetical protein [Thiothrix sp.]MDD5394268.1 hypothetical protein [Thiothrix sp.]